MVFFVFVSCFLVLSNSKRVSLLFSPIMSALHWAGRKSVLAGAGWLRFAYSKAFASFALGARARAHARTQAQAHARTHTQTRALPHWSTRGEKTSPGSQTGASGPFVLQTAVLLNSCISYPKTRAFSAILKPLGFFEQNCVGAPLGWRRSLRHTLVPQARLCSKVDVRQLAISAYNFYLFCLEGLGFRVCRARRCCLPAQPNPEFLGLSKNIFFLFFPCFAFLIPRGCVDSTRRLALHGQKQILSFERGS